MSLSWAILISITGLVLVVYFSEMLVKGVTGTSLGFQVSPFLISIIFLGFDPENLGVGAAGSYEAVEGIALGSIIGAAMVAIALALGITAAIAPLSFQKVNVKILLVPFISILIFALLAFDGNLTRLDGCVLLVTYVIAIIYLIYLNRKGIDLKAGGEVAETLEKENPPGRWRSAWLMLVSLVAIVIGSELLVEGSKDILQAAGISDTLYGMTILAFLVSMEEIARELPAALKGKSDITMGNVLGSVLAFFLFNAGWIAIVRPVPISGSTISFYLPFSIVTIMIILIMLYVYQRISRTVGILLVLIYLLFVGYGWFL